MAGKVIFWIQIVGGPRRSLSIISSANVNDLRHDVFKLFPHIATQVYCLVVQLGPAQGAEILELGLPLQKLLSNAGNGLERDDTDHNPILYIDVPNKTSMGELVSAVELSIPDVHIKYVSPREYFKKSFFGELKNVPLLCFGKSQEWVDFRFLQVDFEDVTKRIAQILASNNVAALVGVSGCGKTSSGFHFATSKFCFYFEAPDGSGLGSPDFCFALNKVRIALRAFDLPPQQQIDRAVHFWKCFFAARALYLIKLLDLNPNITPLQWLLMQFPLTESEKHQAMFRVCCELFTKLSTSPNVSSLCDEIFVKLRSFDVPFFVFIDEAHALNEPKNVYLWFKTQEKNEQKQEPTRTSLSVIVQSLVEWAAPTVLAGTKLDPFVFDLENVTFSGSSKLGALENKCRIEPIINFPFFEQRNAEENVGKFVSLGDNPLMLDLSGRARFWASFAYVLLMRSSLHSDLASLLASCCGDFSAFHRFGVASVTPLDDEYASLRRHFERQLVKTPPSPDLAKYLYSALATLVVTSLVGLNTPTKLAKDAAAWVAGGICFLHQVDVDHVFLSCKEPLMLDAIVQAILAIQEGRNALLDELIDYLESHKSLLGKHDPGKGILFQRMTMARLLQLSSPAQWRPALKLRELLVEWGVPKDFKFPRWLVPHLKHPVILNRVVKDSSGMSFIGLLNESLASVLLAQPDDAQVGYVGILGGVLMASGGCIFNGQSGKVGEIVTSDEWTRSSDVSHMFVQKDFRVKRNQRNALKAFFVKSKTKGTIRLLFNFETNCKCPLVATSKVKRFEMEQEDLLITFTRANIGTFFQNDKFSKLGSFYGVECEQAKGAGGEHSHSVTSSKEQSEPCMSPQRKRGVSAPPTRASRSLRKKKRA